MTIKELVPYLPYGLKGLVEDFGIETAIGCIGTEVLTTEDNCELSEYKLILRPLSDLTKEIEHNGEKFKPSFVLSRDYKDEFVELLITEKGKGYYNDLLRYIPLCIAEKLFKWHFDVFGLIEKGEAIDINTL